MSERGSVVEKYISFDIETNGPIPVEYAMVSLGACEINAPERSFYRLLKPTTDNYTEKAIKTHKITLEQAKSEGTEPARAMKEFAEWVAQICGANDRLVLVSFGEFDHMFLRYYLVKYGHPELGGPNWLDMKSYAAGMLNCAWSETKKGELRRKGMMTQREHTHNALDDAVEQAELFQLFLAHQKRRGAAKDESGTSRREEEGSNTERKRNINHAWRENPKGVN
jgi:DNA polymerase III epsilon subunit-like protein